MPRRSSAFVRLLLRAYPRQLRIREQRRAGGGLRRVPRSRAPPARSLRCAYAWGRLIADTITAAILLRVDERRRRRLAWHHSQPSTPKEILMTRLWQDVRYAARRLQRAPMFSLVVVATLALTIGATTAVFTVVNAVLLRALPYRDPTRLVLLQQIDWDDAGRLFGARLSRVRGARRSLRIDRGISQPRVRTVGCRAAGTGDRDARVRDALRRRSACSRRSAVRSRAKTTRRARPVAVLSDALVGAHVRTRSGGDRTRHSPRSSALHHRRRHAARLHVSAARTA